VDEIGEVRSMACEMHRKTFARAARLLSIALVILMSAGCNRQGAQTTNARPPKSDFERSIDTVKRGQYVKIYVIRRRDGEALQPDDKTYLRANTPMETGMWIVTEDNRTAIAGAGFEFEPKHLDALNKRFTVEDYTNK
jgi:hypothetical protein